MTGAARYRATNISIMVALQTGRSARGPFGQNAEGLSQGPAVQRHQSLQAFSVHRVRCRRRIRRTIFSRAPPGVKPRPLIMAVWFSRKCSLRTFFSFGESAYRHSTRSRSRNCALVFEACRRGLFGWSVTMAGAVERGDCADAVRHRQQPCETPSGRSCSSPEC